ncbi:hypothetical protein G5714_002708 [Onychostoma macrolepis]|uniref:Uncharacterized protein n=1 Tax=Onychostoma macrolepis TaxID=369639 RepID=A0A7J6D7F4_9TELE|nr:hypothetical protein G5714_002708 [Onychostoma macrolepis]
MPLPGDGTAGSVVSGWLAEIWDTQDLYTVSDVATLFSSEKSWDVSRGFLLVKFQMQRQEESGSWAGLTLKLSSRNQLRCQCLSLCPGCALQMSWLAGSVNVPALEANSLNA